MEYDKIIENRSKKLEDEMPKPVYDMHGNIIYIKKKTLI